MESMVLSVAVGVTTGVASSLIAWWITYRYLSPRVSFSDVIFRRYSKIRGCGYNYQFTVANERRRPAGDLEVTAKFTLKHFPPSTPDNIHNSVTVPTDGQTLPLLAGSTRKKKTIFRLSLLLDDDRFRNELLNFRPYLAQDVVNGLEGSKVSLEQLLAISPESFVRVTAMLTDGTSGSRRVFVSDSYSSDTIQEDLSYQTALCEEQRLRDEPYKHTQQMV